MMRVVRLSHRWSRGGAGLDLAIDGIGPSTRVGDLGRLLGSGADREPGLTIDGHWVDGARLLLGSGLSDGSVVDPRRPEGSMGPVKRWCRGVDSGPLLAVTGGPGAGSAVPLSGPVLVGRGTSADLRVDDITVSLRHFEVEPSPGGIFLQDLGSHNGTFVDGSIVRGCVPVGAGSFIEAGASTFELRRPGRDWSTTHSVSASGAIPVTRPPRRGVPPPPRLPAGSRTTSPPAGSQVRPGALVARVSTLVLSLGFVLWAGAGRYALVAGIAAALALTGVVIDVLGDRRRHRAADHERSRAVAAASEALREAGAAQRRRLNALAPDLVEIGARVERGATSIWQRRRGDEDFLVVRLGTADREWAPDNEPSTRSAAVDTESGLPATVIRRCPVTLDLDGIAVGVVGERRLVLALVRSLVCRIAVDQGPADVAMALLGSRDSASDWDWIKWLPHLGRPGHSGRLVGIDGHGEPRVFEDALRFCGAGGRTGRHLVLIDDRISTARLGDRIRGTGFESAGGAMTLLAIAPSELLLPDSCRFVISLTDCPGAARLERMDDGSAIDFTMDGLPEALAEGWARVLARHEDPDDSMEGHDYGDPVTLTAVLGESAVSADAIGDTWLRAVDVATLVCPLGRDRSGGSVSVDLVADGPHALVVGTTGSGKSELLRSWVASMAARHPPDRVVFVLVDYKGGSAFDACARLPHTVGVVTDLDAHLGDRALRSLEAELRHRELRLRELQMGDLAAYHRAGSPSGPLPRLVVVVDEFAFLAAELPDLMRGLVDVARRGRSLGVHLVLATQRASGSVSAEMRANIDLRIALRVHDPVDSLDVIGCPDAAAIPRARPGLAVIGRGGGEVLLVQSALASARSGIGPLELSVAPFELTGQGRVPNQGAGATVGEGAERDVRDTPSDLEILVERCAAAFAASGLSVPRCPWPEPLPAVLDLADSGESAPGVVVIGRLDDPDRQCYRDLTWEPGAEHLLITGPRRVGKSTALITSLLAGAAARTPDELHVYVVDGHDELGLLADLPHVGAVIRSTEHERQIRMLETVSAEMARRRMRGDRSRLPVIVVAIDDVGELVGPHEGLGEGSVAASLADLARRGPALGVSLVATAAGAADLPPGMSGVMSRRLLLGRLEQAGGSAGSDAGGRATLPPGRGLDLPSGLAFQVAEVADPRCFLARVRVASAPSSRCPAPVEVLTDAVRSGGLGGVDRGADEIWLPVGVAGGDLQPLGIDLAAGEHLFVGGRSGSGVSTALWHLSLMVRSAVPDAGIALVATDSSPLRGVEDLFDHRFGPTELAEAIEMASCDAGRRSVIVVDDCHLVGPPERALEAVTTRVRLVVGGRSERLSSAFGHWSMVARRAGRGLLLAPRLDVDGDLLGTRLPRRVHVPPAPGRGFLVVDGSCRLVQVAGCDLG